MIACKDYELGVCDDQPVKATATEATITLVTTLKSATSADGKLYGVEINSKDSWINKRYTEESETATPESDRLSSSGKNIF